MISIRCASEIGSDATAAYDWSKWRTLLGPIGGSSWMSSIHGWRSSASRDRVAIRMIAWRQSAGSTKPAGSATSPMTASVTSVISSSLVRT